MSKLLPNGVIRAASIILAADVSINETFDYRFGMLQTGHKPMFLATQNQPFSLDGSHMVLDHTNVAHRANRALSSAVNRQAELNKSAR